MRQIWRTFIIFSKKINFITIKTKKKHIKTLSQIHMCSLSLSLFSYFQTLTVNTFILPNLPKSGDLWLILIWNHISKLFFFHVWLSDWFSHIFILFSFVLLFRRVSKIVYFDLPSLCDVFLIFHHSAVFFYFPFF